MKGEGDNVDAQARADTMADTLLGAKTSTLWPDTRPCKCQGNSRQTGSRFSTGGGQHTYDKEDDVKGEALNNTMANTPPEEKAETLIDTISDVKAEPLLDILPDILPPAKSETNLKSLGDVRAKAVVQTMAKTLHEANAKKPLETLTFLKNEIQFDRLSDNLSEQKAKNYAKQR